MSAGEPDPQIPPRPDRTPEEAQQEYDSQGLPQSAQPESRESDAVRSESSEPTSAWAPEQLDAHGADTSSESWDSQPQPWDDQQGVGDGGQNAWGDPPAAPAFGEGSHSPDGQSTDPYASDPYSSHQYGYGAAPDAASGPGQSSGASAPYGSGPSYGTNPAFGDSAAGYAAAPAAGSGPAHADTGSVPQPAPAPGYAPDAHAPKRERTKSGKSKLPLILSLSAVGVVLILVVVGALVIMNMNRTQYGPETVAQEYFDAIAAGDMDAATDVAKATVPNGANETLLNPEIFAASGETIEKVSIGEADIDGDTAAMTATYALGGQDYEVPLTATKTGRQGLFFDQWELTAPTLQTLYLDLTQTEGATVNGEPVDLEMGATEYAVLPGAYEVAIPETKYTQEGTAGITVGFSPEEQPQPAELSVQISVTDEYKDDVMKAVEKKLDECLESGKLETDCGFFSRDGFETDEDKEVYDELRTDDIDFEMTEEPKIVVTDYGAATTGSFYTDSEQPGKVRAVVRTEGGDRYELTTDLMPSGTVTVEDDEIVITYFFNG